MTIIQRHPDPWVDLPFHYAAATLQGLQDAGMMIDRLWTDPSDPRDVTLVFQNLKALTWDEDHGWIVGGFVSGRQGERTVLAAPRQLIGKVLPAPAEVVAAIQAGTGTEPVRLRNYGERDGIDEMLLDYAN